MNSTSATGDSWICAPWRTDTRSAANSPFGFNAAFAWAIVNCSSASAVMYSMSSVTHGRTGISASPFAAASVAAASGVISSPAATSTSSPSGA